MSSLKTTNILNPSSTTNNIVLAADGSTTISTLTATTIQGTIKSGTAVASTSGTAIDFTSIPSWVKRITVMFNGVSTNGSSALMVQLGTSTSIETSGYVGAVFASLTTNCNAGTGQTSGMDTYYNGAAISQYGQMIITNVSSNSWVSTYTMAYSGGSYPLGSGASSKTLSGVLTRVRITTVNGTDTFDAGSINILYEG